jgi:hypothetical protein
LLFSIVPSPLKRTELSFYGGVVFLLEEKKGW